MHDFDKSSEPLLHADRGAATDPSLGRALALVRFLRDRCPWDARQDPASLRPYLLEEAHEVAEAIVAQDDRALVAELGDLLLNLAFQIVLAEERGAFDAEEVVSRLETKMRARHPHIYGSAESPPDWEELKAEERAGRAGDSEQTSEEEDPFAGVPAGLEPLSRAFRVQERVAAAGFDWPDHRGPLRKVHEEAEELLAVLESPTRAGPTSPVADEEDAPIPGHSLDPRVEEEVGDLLFAAVNASRLSGAHPSNALLRAIAKFERRCREVWRLARERGLDPGEASLEQLDALWDETKRRD